MIENEISQAAKRPAHRILVVDGDDDTRHLNTEVLIQFGYHVDAAKDATTGWEAIQLNNYDLLVTDNKMPNVPGVELLMKLRSARMVSIALTSSRETPDLIEFYKHGVNAYVVKPVDFPDFMKAIKQLSFFWAAVNEPPPNIRREGTSTQNDEVISSGKKEVKNEISALHPALGG